MSWQILPGLISLNTWSPDPQTLIKSQLISSVILGHNSPYPRRMRTPLCNPFSSFIWIPTAFFPAGTTREHLGLAMALKVPIFIVISKVDLCTRATVERTVRQLERVLKQPGCNKVPMVIGSNDDAVTAAQQFAQSPKYELFKVSFCFAETCMLPLLFRTHNSRTSVCVDHILVLCSAASRPSSPCPVCLERV